MQRTAKKPEAQGVDGAAPLDLFAYNGVVAPSSGQTQIDDIDHSEPRPVLVAVQTVVPLSPRLGPRQLSLTMDYQPVSNVVSLVPRRSASYLNYCLLEFFGDLVETQNPARRLEALGIYFVGQFVQLSAQDLYKLGGSNASAMEAFETRLTQVGLALGMVLPPSAFDSEISARPRL